jgi:hypothetical protein
MCSIFPYCLPGLVVDCQLTYDSVLARISVQLITKLTFKLNEKQCYDPLAPAAPQAAAK